MPLHLADAPAIDSLRFRRPTGSDDDYEAMVRVMDAANTRDGVPWIPTATNLREEMEGSPGLDPLNDVVLAEIDGAVIAVASAERIVRDGQLDVRRPWPHRAGATAAGHRARAAARNLSRAAEIAGVRGDPYPLTIRGWTAEGETGHQALLSDEGFTIDPLVLPDASPYAR